MNPRATALIATAAMTLGAAPNAFAHQLSVFASTDCEVVLVEAKFLNGSVPVMGEVRIFDGENARLLTLGLGADGTVSVPLADLESTSGLLIEVDTGDHDDYWIVTPEDIARKCQS